MRAKSGSHCPFTQVSHSRTQFSNRISNLAFVLFIGQFLRALWVVRAHYSIEVMFILASPNEIVRYYNRQNKYLDINQTRAQTKVPFPYSIDNLRFE